MYTPLSDESSGAERPFVSAMIVAAGSSTRMGTPKQFLPIGGIPAVVRTLLAFEKAGCIQEVVLICRPEDRESLWKLARSYAVAKLTRVVEGGATRQESVERGIRAADAAAAYFAIHDGARPFISPPLIERVVRAAVETGAAALGVPVKDTVKRVNGEGIVEETPDRRLLWNVQTPQVFERSLYLRAMEHAALEKGDYTDDCQLVERLGEPVRLVEGAYTNIKLTTPEDIRFAEGIVAHEDWTRL